MVARRRTSRGRGGTHTVSHRLGIAPRNTTTSVHVRIRRPRAAVVGVVGGHHVGRHLLVFRITASPVRRWWWWHHGVPPGGRVALRLGVPLGRVSGVGILLVAPTGRDTWTRGVATSSSHGRHRRTSRTHHSGAHSGLDLMGGHACGVGSGHGGGST